MLGVIRRLLVSRALPPESPALSVVKTQLLDEVFHARDEARQERDELRDLLAAEQAHRLRVSDSAERQVVDLMRERDEARRESVHLLRYVAKQQRDIVGWLDAKLRRIESQDDQPAQPAEEATP